MIRCIQRILNLLETIYNNFEDYPDLIRADITKNSLTSYIDSYLNAILDTREFNKRDIILGLEELLNQAYINKDLLKLVIMIIEWNYLKILLIITLKNLIIILINI